jgi:beta-lactamase class A
MRRISTPVVIACAAGGIGLVVGIFLTSSGLISSSSSSSFTCALRYPLTSQEIDCDEYETSAAKMKALDATYNAMAEQYVKDARVKRISIWSRDLVTRQWAAANETETYTPASLLKLPVMIAYFKLAQLDPDMLSKEIQNGLKNTDVDTQDYATPLDGLTPGATYTIGSLIDTMMSESDNAAAQLLKQHLAEGFFNQTLVELGVQIPKSNDEIDFVTVKTYGNMLRILYNASYLNRDFSQKALSIMTHSSFKGITAGVPDGTTVAHKFGERTALRSSGEAIRQLHDCGIIYKKPNPYSLCIMMEGADFDAMNKILEEVSRAAYEAI